jgi:hypothetical protein
MMGIIHAMGGEEEEKLRQRSRGRRDFAETTEAGAQTQTQDPHAKSACGAPGREEKPKSTAGNGCATKAGEPKNTG